MACMLTIGVRNFGPDGQPLLSANERRPLTMERISDFTHRECFEVMKKKGKDFLVPIKFSNKLKPEYHHLVKSKQRTLTAKEKERIVNSAKVLTADERLEALAKQEDLTRRKNEQAENAKKYFRKIDDEKKKAADSADKEEDEDLFGIAEKKKTLDSAFLAKQEQEEEIKAVNRCILLSQCQAVRDLQIREKRELNRKQTEERIRLEKMVIEENAKALAKEDEYAIQRRERSAKYADEIRQQLLQRETQRIMEAERIEEEGRIFKEANAALQREEERLAQIVREHRVKFREDLDRIVEMSKLFRKMLYEQECEVDRRIAIYQKEKLDREEQLKKEKALAKETLEKKQILLYELAKKLASSKTEREELNTLRERERAERDFRKREKEAALRRKKLEDDMRQALKRQVEEVNTRKALQIAREEQSFNEMIATLKASEEQERKIEEERVKRRDNYCKEIKKQMKDKAEIHRLLLENIRKENDTWREAERQRLANIRAVVSAKLSAMRDACLPESYIKDIERLVDRIIKRNPTQNQN